MERKGVSWTFASFIIATVTLVCLFLIHNETFSSCKQAEKDLCVLKGETWCLKNTKCSEEANESIRKVSPHGACAPTAPANTTRLSKRRDLAVVIGRYASDTSQFESHLHQFLNAGVTVYDKFERNASNPHVVLKNKGNEAAVYLKYVVDNYDRLHEYTAFLHEDEYSCHHDGSAVDLLRTQLEKSVPPMYININSRDFRKVEARAEKEFRKWWDHYMEPEFHWADLPQPAFQKAFIARCCAQFLVHKNRITRQPLAFYQRMYTWIQDQEELSSAYSGRFFEWTWHIIWGDSRHQ